jgi:hypothetical protein
MVEDEQIDWHTNSVERGTAYRRIRVDVEVVDDDCEVKIAVRTEIAAGAGAECDDTNRVSDFHDALDGCKDFLLGDTGVELEW